MPFLIRAGAERHRETSAGDESSEKHRKCSCPGSNPGVCSETLTNDDERTRHGKEATQQETRTEADAGQEVLI